MLTTHVRDQIMLKISEFFFFLGGGGGGGAFTLKDLETSFNILHIIMRVK